MKEFDSRNVQPVILEPFQVTAAECKGDFRKMVKKFSKKCRKSEVLKCYFDKMYYKSKSQKKREKHSKAVYEQKKLMEQEK